MADAIEADQLRAKAREAIRAGKLPTARPTRVWGGHGFGTSCAICDRPMDEDEIGFELEFTREDHDGGAGEFHLHARCFAAWDVERQSPHLPASNSNGTIGNRERRPDRDESA